MHQCIYTYGYAIVACNCLYASFFQIGIDRYRFICNGQFKSEKDDDLPAACQHIDKRSLKEALFTAAMFQEEGGESLYI